MLGGLEARRGGGSETRRRSRGDGLAASVARGEGLTAGRGRVRGAAVRGTAGSCRILPS